MTLTLSPTSPGEAVNSFHQHLHYNIRYSFNEGYNLLSWPVMASCSRELVNIRLFIVNECDHDSYDISAIYEHKHTYLYR